MSHYEERLEKDLATIREKIAAVAKRIEKALADSVHSVLTMDRHVAYATVLGDMPINRQIRDIDRMCHAFVARHLPSAGHLRFVSSVLRLNVALERIGDYAAAISREAVILTSKPPDMVARDIELLADQHGRMLRQSLDAFLKSNAEMARGTIGMAGQLTATFSKVYADLLGEGEKGKRPIGDLFALLVIFNRLGRVGDQAKNICEETVFTVTGETKKPKIWDILFVDERNDCISQLAEAYARKAFPESGRYASAGWNPAPALDPECRRYFDTQGYDTSRMVPSRIPEIPEELAAYRVIVSFGGDIRPHVPGIPFHSIVLEWNVGGGGSADIESIRKTIADRTRDLMETLCGEGAA